MAKHTPTPKARPVITDPDYRLPSDAMARVLRSRWTWLGLAATLILLGYALSPILLPFIVAFTLSYILFPIQVKILSFAQGQPFLRRVPTELWTGLLILIACLLVLGVGLLLLPMLFTEVPRLMRMIPEALPWVSQKAGPLLLQWDIKIPDSAELTEKLKEQILTYSDVIAKGLLQSVLIGGSALATLIGNALLIPIVLFYTLLEWPKIVATIKTSVPSATARPLGHFASRCDALIGQYFHGQILVMLILCVYYSAALWLANVPWAVSIGTFTGLAICIPYFGFALGALLAVGMTLAHWSGPDVLIWVGVIYFVGQMAESIYLTPKLVGEKIGLHPLMVIFLLMALGQLMGFIGVLLALPLGAILMVIVQMGFEAYKKSELFDPPISGK